MVTEIVAFPLRDGEYSATQTRKLQVLLKVLDIVPKQPGFERAFWGQKVEKSDVMHLLVDWSTVEAHQAFQRASDYKPFIQELDQVADVSKITAFHVTLSLTPATTWLRMEDPLEALLEVVTLFFPAELSTAAQVRAAEDVGRCIAAVKDQHSTLVATGCGWAIERVALPGSEREASAYIACLSWQSPQHLNAFQCNGSSGDSDPRFNGVAGLQGTKVILLRGATVSHGQLF